MKPVREAGKGHYYPKWLEPFAAGICAAYLKGATTRELSIKYDCARHYIANILKVRGVARPPGPRKTKLTPRPKLIRHRSERCNYSLYIAEQKPEPPKMRKCIGHCGKLFLSEHKGHRRCEPCSKTVANSLSDDYSMVIG